MAMQVAKRRSIPILLVSLAMVLGVAQRSAAQDGGTTKAQLAARDGLTATIDWHANLGEKARQAGDCAGVNKEVLEIQFNYGNVKSLRQRASSLLTDAQLEEIAKHANDRAIALFRADCPPKQTADAPLDNNKPQTVRQDSAAGEPTSQTDSLNPPLISSYKSPFGSEGEHGFLFDQTISVFDQIFADATKARREGKTDVMTSKIAVLEGGSFLIIEGSEQYAVRLGIDFRFTDREKAMLEAYAAGKAAALRQLPVGGQANTAAKGGGGLTSGDVDRIKDLPIEPLRSEQKQKPSKTTTKHLSKTSTRKASGAGTTKSTGKAATKSAPVQNNEAAEQVGQQILQGAIQYGIGSALSSGSGHSNSHRGDGGRTTINRSSGNKATSKTTTTAPAAGGGAGKSYLFQGFTVNPGR
jgi:hypothetical protein